MARAAVISDRGVTSHPEKRGRTSPFPPPPPCAPTRFSAFRLRIKRRTAQAEREKLTLMENDAEVSPVGSWAFLCHAVKG